jgi:hypothetical protein
MQQRGIGVQQFAHALDVSECGRQMDVAFSPVAPKKELGDVRVTWCSASLGRIAVLVTGVGVGAMV